MPMHIQCFITPRVPTLQGKVIPIGGTSLAGPMVAAILSLLNAKQLERGHPPLGAPHAWLYAAYAANPRYLQR